MPDIEIKTSIPNASTKALLKTKAIFNFATQYFYENSKIDSLVDFNFKNSDFYKELKEVYDVSLEITKKGDASEEIAIAQFWDCNPYVSVNRGHLMFAVKKNNTRSSLDWYY